MFGASPPARISSILPTFARAAAMASAPPGFQSLGDEYVPCCEARCKRAPRV